MNEPFEWVDGVGVFKGTRVPVAAFFEFMIRGFEDDGVCDVGEFVRLYPEVSVEQATAYAESIARSLNESDERREKARTMSLTWLAAGQQAEAKKPEPVASIEPDLKYDPASFACPLDIEELQRQERLRTDQLPHMRYDPVYVAHLTKHHGGVPGKGWFRTRQGNVYRLGRLLNFATEETLPPPFQPSWLDKRRDLRLEWSVGAADSIANIAEGCGAWLVPFGILYSGPHHPDGMDLTHADLVCFDYKGSGRPRVVVWLNDQAVDEKFRCDEEGRDGWTDLDHSRFTEEVADSFTDLLAMLREREDEV